MASKKGVDIAELIKAKEAQRKKVLEPEVEAEEETKETKVRGHAHVHVFARSFELAAVEPCIYTLINK